MRPSNFQFGRGLKPLHTSGRAKGPLHSERDKSLLPSALCPLPFLDKTCENTTSKRFSCAFHRLNARYNFCHSWHTKLGMYTSGKLANKIAKTCLIMIGLNFRKQILWEYTSKLHKDS